MGDVERRDRSEWLKALGDTVRGLRTVPIGVVLADLVERTVIAYNPAAEALIGEAPPFRWDDVYVKQMLAPERAVRLRDDLRTVATGPDDAAGAWHQFRTRSHLTDEPIVVTVWHLRHPSFASGAVMVYLRPGEGSPLAWDDSSETPPATGPDGASTVLFVVDEHYSMVLVDPAVRGIGFDPSELVGQSAEAFVHPEDLPAAFAAIARVEEDVTPSASYRARILTARGTWVLAELEVRRTAAALGPSYAVLVRPLPRVVADDAVIERADAPPSTVADVGGAGAGSESLTASGFNPIDTDLPRDEWLQTIVRMIQSHWFEASGIAAALVSPAENLVVTSASTAGVLGYEDLPGPWLRNALSPESRTRIIGLMDALPDEPICSGQTTISPANEPDARIPLSLLRVRRDDEEPIYVTFIWRDRPPAPAATPRRWLWARIDMAGQLLSISRRGMAGQPERLLGGAIWAAVHPDDLVALVPPLAELVAGSRDSIDATVRMPRPQLGWAAVPIHLEMHTATDGPTILIGLALPDDAPTARDGNTKHGDPRLARLTPREREIIEAVLRGERVPTIARREHLAESTIRNHLSAAFRKLGVRSQVELIERFRARPR